MIGNSANINDVVIFKDGDGFAFPSAAFYVGGFSQLSPLGKGFFKWRKSEEYTDEFGNPVYVLTLGELAEQITKLRERRGFSIMLFVESPLDGFVFEYGNHGSYWVKRGNLKGFA